jgi:hypothetical protein
MNLTFQQRKALSKARLVLQDCSRHLFRLLFPFRGFQTSSGFELLAG